MYVIIPASGTYCSKSLQLEHKRASEKPFSKHPLVCILRCREVSKTKMYSCDVRIVLRVVRGRVWYSCDVARFAW
jgi:hypothetical protein